jgi:hypothetical protein
MRMSVNMFDVGADMQAFNVGNKADGSGDEGEGEGEGEGEEGAIDAGGANAFVWRPHLDLFREPS